MASLHQTVHDLALLRNFLLVAVLFGLTSVGAMASCVPKEGEPCEVKPDAIITLFIPQTIEESEPSPSKVDNSPTLTEKTSLTDSITFQPDSPALSTQDSSDTRPLSGRTTSNSAESVTPSTDESSNTRPLSCRITSNSEESVILSKDDSSNTRPSSRTTSNTEETVTSPTDDSSNTRPLSGQTISNTEESVTLATVESEVTTTSDFTDSRFLPDEISTMLNQFARAAYGSPVNCPPLRSYPFADKISDDPCKFITGSKSVKKEELRNQPEFVKQVYDYFKYQIRMLKMEVDSALTSDVMNICSEVTFPTVAAIPTPEDLEPLGNGGIYFLYYSSMVNHTAHLHNVAHLLQSYDYTCNKGTLYVKAKRIALDSIRASCFLRMFILSVYDEYVDESFEKPSKEVLELELCDERICSRRALNDCLILTSFQKLLNHLQSFVKNPYHIEALRRLNPAVLKRFKKVVNHLEL